MFIYTEGTQNPIHWSTRDGSTDSRQGSISNPSWAKHAALVEARIKDELIHFYLKSDLVNHRWLLSTRRLPHRSSGLECIILHTVGEKLVKSGLSRDIYITIYYVR